MKKFSYFILLFGVYFYGFSQIETPPKDFPICDEDRDGEVSISFSELQNYVFDVLQQFNESPEIYVTKSRNGISKIINLYDNPQVINICSSDGNGGYYDIAINSQKEIYIVRNSGILQKIDTNNCSYQTIGQIHPNGQSVLALSFDHLNHLYEGGWESQVYRADAQNLEDFRLWHDFGNGNAAGDFVQIGNFLYVAWRVNGDDYLYKVTLGNNNAYVSHENLGRIDPKTYGLAAEYGKLYGNTPDYLYEINLNTMETTIVKRRPNLNNSQSEWWGAAGYHEALNIQISYHEERDQAINGTDILSEPYITNSSRTIYIRVHEETGNTTYIIPVNIIISTPPLASDVEQIECQDQITGLATFQLDSTEFSINPDYQNLFFTYFESEEDRENNQNPLPLSYSINESTTIFVKVQDNSNSDCFGKAELKLIIPSAELVNYDANVSFCLGTSTVLEIPDEFNSYQWNGLNTEDLNQNLNTYFVTVTQPGSYSVTVTDDNNCSFSLPFEVTLGGAPEITNVEINGSTITVQVSPDGNYEYSIDGVFWQSSPTFYNLAAENYDIYVRDLVGCHSEAYKFTYFLIPNFISPNGDGKNDIWKIKGIEQYPDAEFQIFDRYGKLFAKHKANNNGEVWDGKYLGRPVSSGTYWYIITFSESANKITGTISVCN